MSRLLINNKKNIFNHVSRLCDKICATAVQFHLSYNQILKPFTPVLVVLPAGDPGDGHRRRDRHRLDHQEQDCGHAVSGHCWILTGRATNNTGKSQTHVDRTFKVVFSRGDAVSTHSLFSVCRLESIGCCWWTTTLLASLWLSSPA